MNILFMGTPDFATASLAALLDAGKHVCAVVTQPDKARGRGMKVTFSDVKKFALEKELPVLQPETLKNGAFLPTLEEYKPDLIAVVAYGKILPEYILNYPKYGCVNVHGSLLPKYRGAAPIQRAVLNGDSVSGVTTMRLDKGMDTGDMYLSEAVEIGENMTTGELFDALAEIGGNLLVQTVDALENGSAKPLPQDMQTPRMPTKSCRRNVNSIFRFRHARYTTAFAVFRRFRVRFRIWTARLSSCTTAA